MYSTQKCQQDKYIQSNSKTHNWTPKQDHSGRHLFLLLIVFLQSAKGRRLSMKLVLRSASNEMRAHQTRAIETATKHKARATATTVFNGMAQDPVSNTESAAAPSSSSWSWSCTKSEIAILLMKGRKRLVKGTESEERRL